MRVFLIIVFLLASLPMIMTGFFQVAAGAMMYQTTKKISADIAIAEGRGKAYTDSLDVQGHLTRRKKPMNGYLSLLHPESMEDLRSVSVTRTVPMSAFLERGEAKPAKEYYEILVSSRAMKVAEKECALITDKLADACSVRYAKARVDERGRKVVLRADYNFIQKGGIGAFDETKPLRYVAVQERFTRKGTPSESSRRTVYRKVAEMCRPMRRSDGNCGVSHVNVSTGRDGRSLSVKATLSTLQRR